MWFKQIQIFQLKNMAKFSVESLSKKLEQLKFSPCLPSLFSSAGWISPLENKTPESEMPLVRSVNQCIMLCLQIEEKILPPIVVRQELSKKIKHLEETEHRKLSQQEKLSLKDEIIITLLPRAFTRLTKIYGYIDIKNNRFILGTANAKKTELFISLFKKTTEEELKPYEIKNLSSTITHWLQQQNYPSHFGIEKSCMLQDPTQHNRIIRCQHQDLFANSIQSLIKEGCEVKQLGIAWYDRVSFVLTEFFVLKSIKFQDNIRFQNDEEGGTKHQQFDSDFLIMSETLGAMLNDLLAPLSNLNNNESINTNQKKIALTLSAV